MKIFFALALLSSHRLVDFVVVVAAVVFVHISINAPKFKCRPAYNTIGNYVRIGWHVSRPMSDGKHPDADLNCSQQLPCKIYRTRTKAALGMPMILYSCRFLYSQIVPILVIHIIHIIFPFDTYRHWQVKLSQNQNWSSYRNL